MRRAVVAFAAVFLLGLAGLAVAGATRGSGLVYSTGAQASGPVAALTPGDRACQGPYLVPSGETFDRIGLWLGTYGKTGAPVHVVVREADGGREIAAGDQAGGYADNSEHVVPVGRVDTSAALEVCITNEGDVPVGVLGQPGLAAPQTTAEVNGKALPIAMALTLRTRERSLIALLPDMAERAATFRAGWVTPAVYAILAVLVLVAAPLLLARGIGRAAEEDRA